VVGFEVKPESRSTAGYEIKGKTCQHKADVAQADQGPQLIEPKGKCFVGKKL